MYEMTTIYDDGTTKIEQNDNIDQIKGVFAIYMMSPDVLSCTVWDWKYAHTILSYEVS